MKFKAYQKGEQHRDLITAVSNLWGASVISARDYANDAIGRRTSRNADTFGYNQRSEVVNASIVTNQWAYLYDSIGNRIAATENAETTEYVANELNQYSQISESPASSAVNPIYDHDGNLLSLGDWSYTWDAENRMIAAVSNGISVAAYEYDYLGRCVAETTDNAIRRFIWDAWNIVATVDIDATAPTTNVTHYLWGPDLSGTLQGAGGVGGLLAVISADDIFLPCYDANGNVTEYVDANGVIVARYEYSPFGETIDQSGVLADSFLFRFSTKPYHRTTGLYKYELRDYHPGLGRWLNRDPIEEQGGMNLYGFAGNDPVSRIDRLGLSFWDCCDDCCGTILDAVDTQLWPALYDNRVSPNMFKAGFDLLSAINASGNISDLGDIASSCTSVPGLLSAVAKALINKGMNWDVNTAIEQGLTTLINNINKVYGEAGGYVIYVRIDYRMCDLTRTCYKLKQYRTLNKKRTFSQRYSNIDRISGFLESDGFFLPGDEISLQLLWKQSIKDAINAIPD